jgi:flagellar protein FliS
MTYGRGVKAYTEAQVSTTTNQKQLIVMAYDGILRFLNTAKTHIANRDIEAKYDMLLKARAIVEELAGTLNMEEGGEIAKNLWNLYVYFMQKIGEANLTNECSHIDDILPAVKSLREAWVGMEIPESDVEVQALNRRVPTTEEAHRVSITG